jgi:hypothetical protein
VAVASFGGGAAMKIWTARGEEAAVEGGSVNSNISKLPEGAVLVYGSKVQTKRLFISTTTRTDLVALFILGAWTFDGARAVAVGGGVEVAMRERTYAILSEIGARMKSAIAASVRSGDGVGVDDATLRLFADVVAGAKDAAHLYPSK